MMREGNEDNFLVADLSSHRVGIVPEVESHDLRSPGGTLFLVCDGMGGALAGEVASKMAADTILQTMCREPLPSTHRKLVRRMDRAIKEASRAIFTSSRRNMKQRGMGTTITASALIDGRLFIGQVGDSRAYIMRADEIFLVTKDQSLLNQLIEAGQIKPEDAKDFEYQNVILQAAGTQENITPEFTFVDLRKGDILCMCSDGLHGMVGDDVMAYTILNGGSLPDGCKDLIAQANRNGGHDNISVILARFTGDALPEAVGERILYQTVEVEETDEDLEAEPSAGTPASPEQSAQAVVERVPGDDAAVAPAAWADEDFPEITRG